MHNDILDSLSYAWNCKCKYDSKGKLYLKRLKPGMRLMVWCIGEPALLNGIVKDDTYEFIRKYETVAGDYRYLIRNLNKDKTHHLETWEMIDIFGLSPEDPDIEQQIRTVKKI